VDSCREAGIVVRYVRGEGGIEGGGIGQIRRRKEKGMELISSPPLFPFLPPSLSMVTGDHPKTAAAIARQVAILSPDQKLPEDLIMAAKDFDACDDSQVSTHPSFPPSFPPFLPPVVASSWPASLF